MDDEIKELARRMHEESLQLDDDKVQEEISRICMVHMASEADVLASLDYYVTISKYD